jgi:pSer/pThr/pTyr-binding forkhead associated (FHA) protein
MFKFFKSESAGHPKDVKELRDALLRFIKEQLQKVEGGEGKYIKSIFLFLTCEPEDRHLYESAVNLEEPGRFKNEIQKIADDFALDLPQTWTLEVKMGEELPPGTINSSQLAASILISTKNQPMASAETIEKLSTAYIRVLKGEAENEEYQITSAAGKINIGRDRRAQGDDGFFRMNTIAFPGESTNESNKFISRRHAHIEFNNETISFVLFADEGGIPPRNKIKIRAVDDENLIKLNSTLIGHQLKEGDQVILGESAVIEFSYISAST